MCTLVSSSLATVCAHTVSDSKAAPSSENQSAQASVSDASLIRVEDFIFASPQWTASLSVRPALAVRTPTRHPAPELADVMTHLQSFFPPIVLSISLSTNFVI